MTHLKRLVFFILPMFALALAAGCSSKKALPQAPFVSHMPYLGLEFEQLEEALRENNEKLGETSVALAEAQREECDVSVGDVLLWGALAGATNDDSVCRELETEVLRLRATADAIEGAESEKGYKP